MNDAKKGITTAVIATVVTSAMILMSGAGIADNSQSAEGKDESKSIEKTTIEIVQENNVTTEVITTESSINSESGNFATSNNKDVSIARIPPPPGPFSEKEAETLVVPKAPELSAPPILPEAPKQQSTVGVSVVPEAPKKLVDAPVQKEAVLVAPKPLVKPEKKSAETNAPELTTQIPKQPFAPEVRSLKPEPIKSPQLLNDKLITNQQVPKTPVAPQVNTLQKPSPKTNSNGQPIWMQMPSNPNGVRYMQQYRYMPMPVYPNYHYPQASQYNGGYYFAPNPNQWMQGGMQRPAQQNRQQHMQQKNIGQNQSAPDINEQKGLNK